MGMSPSHLVTRNAGFFTAFSIPKQDSLCLMQLNGHESRLSAEHKANGGEGGIRTPDTLSGMPVFKTGAINHSATSPAITVLL